VFNVLNKFLSSYQPCQGYGQIAAEFQRFFSVINKQTLTRFIVFQRELNNNAE